MRTYHRLPLTSNNQLMGYLKDGLLRQVLPDFLAASGCQSQLHHSQITRLFIVFFRDF